MMETKEQLFEVDGKKVSKEELEQLQQDPKIRLKPLQEGNFKILKRMQG